MNEPAFDIRPAPVGQTLILDHNGRHLIQTVYDLLKIDPQWTEWHEDGFTWWAQGLAQRFRAEGPEQVDGIPTYWLSFETSVLRGVAQDAPEVHALVGMQNRMNNLFTTNVTADGRLIHWGRVYALPESVTHRAKQLGERAIISNVMATRQADATVTFLTGRGLAAEVDHSGHPVCGRRAEADEMLTVLEATYLPFGAAPLPPAKRADFSELATSIKRRGLEPLASEDGQHLGVVGDIEGLAFGLHLDLMARHPVLGSGMLALLQVPLGTGLTVSEVNQVALQLNDAERTARWPLNSLGSWTAATAPAAEEGGAGAPLKLAHATFYPALSLNHGVAVEALTDALQRMEWLAGFLKTS